MSSPAFRICTSCWWKLWVTVSSGTAATAAATAACPAVISAGVSTLSPYVIFECHSVVFLPLAALYKHMCA
ncbi:hypothetical protein R1flu_022390 [Riccia fluitans]|uniref:Secreted protein n=1 Tax=Riccia fluitans TaxID=41844 RepID=A0ABD1ZSQ2_9MARC